MKTVATLQLTSSSLDGTTQLAKHLHGPLTPSDLAPDGTSSTTRAILMREASEIQPSST